MFVFQVIPLETDKKHLTELARNTELMKIFFLGNPKKPGHTHINEFCPLKNAFHLCISEYVDDESPLSSLVYSSQTGQFSYMQDFES